MEIITQTLFTSLIFVSGLLGISHVDTHSLTMPLNKLSVELGLKEVSPKGEQGGYAIPASGCSNPHTPPRAGDCDSPSDHPTIDVTPPIVRQGDTVTVTWDPKQNIGCALSSTVTSLKGLNGNPNTTPSAAASGSLIDKPQGMTTYSINCPPPDGSNNDSATVKVLVEVQET